MKYNFPSFLIASVVFLSISLPSLKMIFLSSPLLNLLPILIAFGTCFLVEFKTIRKVKKTDVLGLVIGLFFLLGITASYFIGLSASFGVEEAVKLFSIVIISLFLFFYLDGGSIDLALWMLIVWGGWVSVQKLFWGIDFGETAHYLTAGIPIAIGVLAIMSYVFYKPTFVMIIVSFVYVILAYAALFTLFGRSPILFSVAVVVGFFVFQLFCNGRQKVLSKLLSGFSLFGVIVGLVYVWNLYLPFYLKDKILRGASSEPRIDAVYMPAVEAIKVNPFGYGLGKSEDLIGFYPHNIFLEILMSGGVCLLVIFLILLIRSLYVMAIIVKVSDLLSANYLGLVFVCMFLFLVWNVSFDLLSAYALIPLIFFFSCIGGRLATAQS